MTRELKKHDVIVKLTFNELDDLAFARTSVVFYRLATNPNGDGYWYAQKQSGRESGLFTYDMDFFKTLAPYTILSHGEDSIDV